MPLTDKVVGDIVGYPVMRKVLLVECFDGVFVRLSAVIDFVGSEVYYRITQDGGGKPSRSMAVNTVDNAIERFNEVCREAAPLNGFLNDEKDLFR